MLHVMLCDARVAFTVYGTCGAAAYVPFPAWFASTVHDPVPLVMVMLALDEADPVLQAVPDQVRATANPELAVHATLKVPL